MSKRSRRVARKQQNSDLESDWIGVAIVVLALLCIVGLVIYS